LTTLILPKTGTESQPVSHVEKFTYRYSDGQLASASDQNNPPNYTSYSYADALGRLTETDYPDGGKTTVAYNDTASPPTVVTKKLLAGYEVYDNHRRTGRRRSCDSEPAQLGPGRYRLHGYDLRWIGQSL
jgi:hypothetical protein